ncbi:MAG: hypothetical protein Fur0034_07200 [Desulfuromonadia bacterium]
MNDASTQSPLTADTVSSLLSRRGATVHARSGRTESYGAPRDYSFEVRGLFPNGMELRVIARQFTYRDPWEGGGRVNDQVDLLLLRGGEFTPLPRGFDFFQGREIEEGVDAETLDLIVQTVSSLNPKIYELQRLMGDF